MRQFDFRIGAPATGANQPIPMGGLS